MDVHLAVMTTRTKDCPVERAICLAAKSANQKLRGSLMAVHSEHQAPMDSVKADHLSEMRVAL